MNRLVTTGFVVALLVLALTGCSTIADAVSSAVDSLDSAFSETGDAGSGGTPGIKNAGPLVAMQHVVLFNVAYMQGFLLAGYGPAFDDFDEGEGVIWKTTLVDEDGADEFQSERALLKRVDNGSWWYLAYLDEDQDIVYEALLDDGGEPVELVWRDPDSGDLYRYVYDEDDDTEPAEAVADGRFDEQYHQGTRRVTVGAGTYTADYIVYDYTDPESKETFEYHWWVAEEVPGDLVKYEYRDVTGDEVSIQGELMQVRDGYETTFGSY